MKNIYKKAFTLIELLIVIALLGALAVGLLAALDPFEQLKKGTDTGVRNTVSEYQGSIIRYYSLKNQMPWCTNSDCTATVLGWVDDSDTMTLDSAPMELVTDAIIDTGELKSDFESLATDATLSKITVFGNNTDSTVTVCYKPASKSFTNDPNTKFDPSNGEENGNGGTCVADPDPATNTCLWCVK